MLRVFPSCRIEGPQFSPRMVEAKTGLAFDIKYEPGEIAARGRYKGQPRPTGSAVLRLGAEASQGQRPEEQMIALLQQHLGTLTDAGAADIVLHLDVEYEAQCNLAFEPDFLQKLAELRIPFTVTCYAAEAEE